MYFQEVPARSILGVYFKYTSRIIMFMVFYQEIEVLSFNGEVKHAKSVLLTERVKGSNLSTLHNLHEFTTCFANYTNK